MIFLVGGLGKIATLAMTQGQIASAGLLAYLVAIAIEIGGGLFLVILYQARRTGHGRLQRGDGAELPP
jgi:putative oxidoreductase